MASFIQYVDIGEGGPLWRGWRYVARIEAKNRIVLVPRWYAPGRLVPNRFAVYLYPKPLHLLVRLKEHAIEHVWRFVWRFLRCWDAG